jgi:hypothetical protein
MKVLLSTAYWPNLHYFFYVINAAEIQIEAQENYQKQSFRNRTSILTANGKLDLTIPVIHESTTSAISEIRISYSENWQIKHWRAITSAYKNSPFFEYFEEEIRMFYDKKFEKLFEFNCVQLETVLKIMRLKKQLNVTASYDLFPAGVLDLRSHIHPKKTIENDQKINSILKQPYYQTFENKFGFTPNLSILDLVFNEGLSSRNYFPSETFML